LKPCDAERRGKEDAEQSSNREKNADDQPKRGIRGGKKEIMPCRKRASSFQNEPEKGGSTLSRKKNT